MEISNISFETAEHYRDFLKKTIENKIPLLLSQKTTRGRVYRSSRGVVKAIDAIPEASYREVVIDDGSKMFCRDRDYAVLRLLLS